MINCIRKNTPCLPSWWIPFTLQHSLVLVITAIVLTGGVLAYTLVHFKINTDLTDMVSNRLPFRKIYKEYRQAFPVLFDTVALVIEADTPEQALDARKRLALRLASEKQIFKTVYQPGGGPFFEKNGLLYLSVEELEELSDHLAEMQPFLAGLNTDFSLGGLFAVLEKILVHGGETEYENQTLQRLFNHLGSAMAQATQADPVLFSWQEFLTVSEDETDPLRQFIIVQPFLDYSLLYPAKEAIDTIRRVANELRLIPEAGVRVFITGETAINYDDLVSVEQGIGAAALVSLVLVGVVLYIGLRSARLVFISLATLVMGLIWTLGFAIAFIGSLNMISVAFAVLFIGLGIDYSIQLCLRYREMRVSGIGSREAVALSVQKLSNAFILCTFTTAIGFFAFVPTAYAGASELGIISGTGMFINLFLNLTVLPALLNLIVRPLTHKRSLVLNRKVRLVPEKHARTIATGALILGIGAALLIPKVFFDNNPLNLSNPNAESVIIAKQLFKNGKTAPWRISVMADSLAEARALAAKLSKLEEVEMAITIADFIPPNQAEKIDLIADMTLFMPPGIGQKERSSPSLEQYRSRLQSFRSAVDQTLLAIPEANHAFRSIMQRLQTHLVRLDALLHTAPESGHAALLRLDEGLLSNLSTLLQNLEAALQPAVFSIPDLPEALRQSFVSDNAQHYRIEVFPHGNLAVIHTLERFVAAVRTIALQATDAPVTILESGRAIVSAFWHASIGALAVIAIFLWWSLRRISEIILILIPLTLAVLLTGASTVLLDLPFNFANIIVVPLLLGTGVDYSIHLMHRFRTEGTLDNGLLATSTSRAVLFSALTTIVSFGSLSFLSHSGTASMGKLLTLCIFFTILSVLVVLPALLALNRRSRATLYGSR